LNDSDDDKDKEGVGPNHVRHLLTLTSVL